LGAYLMGVHGVRPPHLGKKNIAKEAAVGPVYFIPPIAGYDLENLPSRSKGLVLWILEGFVLSREEIAYLINLTQQEAKLKIVLELGGDRSFRWQPLNKIAAAA
jgi:NAD(P)H-quinone oxidoreductase subunit N